MTLPKETLEAIDSINTSIDKNVLKAFIEVESGGKGFTDSGKLIIQFEPAWFRKKAPFAPTGLWSVNKVDIQSKEWEAFNNAFAIDSNAAMLSTSIGLPQIMGFHWARLGYSSVGAMWDDFKSGIKSQIEALIKFIETDGRLQAAINNKDWHMIAYIYNGSGYAELAHRIGREPYNISLKNAYEKYHG